MAFAKFLLLHLLGWLLTAGLSAGLAADVAEPAPLAARSLLLDVTRAGTRLVAVGQHGDVVVSDDHGITWSQRIVPTRSLLTATNFIDAKHGWVVGHDGVILSTIDGGENWQRQDVGHDLDTVYLDVLFLDAQRGFAVGAYGKFMHTVDGGAHWQAGHPVDSDFHFNHLSRGVNGSLYLAGEAGQLLQSTDEGHTWSRLPIPYEGSLYGVLPLADGRLLAYGLRGHLFLSDNTGITWRQIDHDANSLLMVGVQLDQHYVILSGQSGRLLRWSTESTRAAEEESAAGLGPIAALCIAADGALIAAGEGGVVRITTH